MSNYLIDHDNAEADDADKAVSRATTPPLCYSLNPLPHNPDF